jgi:hypothetical protein
VVNAVSGASAAQLGASHGSDGDDIAGLLAPRTLARAIKCCRFAPSLRPRSLRPSTGAMEP